MSTTMHVTIETDRAVFTLVNTFEVEKSVCVSFLAAYPTIAILQGIVMQRLTFLPDAARGVVMGLLMCIVLTYALMPALTRLLTAWLYPAPAHPTAAP